MRRWCLFLIVVVAVVSGRVAQAACADPVAEVGAAIIYNSTFDVFQGCTSPQGWVRFHVPGAGSGGCTDPAGSAGDTVYNTTFDVFQGCTSQGWVRFHAPGTGSGGCADPAGSAGDIIFNTTWGVYQGCTAHGWRAFHPMPPCEARDPGAMCNDGSIYAGLSPDENGPMFTTPADAGLIEWNNGNSTGYINTTLADCIDAAPGTASTCHTGASNTAALITLDSSSAAGGVQPHLAAQYCANLSAHGKTDWYLPSQDELVVVRGNRNAGALAGTFDLTGTNLGGTYWSSSEDDNDSARSVRFSDGFQADRDKAVARSTRCVRKN